MMSFLPVAGSVRRRMVISAIGGPSIRGRRRPAPREQAPQALGFDDLVGQEQVAQGLDHRPMLAEDRRGAGPRFLQDRADAQ